jgi:hypothetical protein
VRVFVGISKVGRHEEEARTKTKKLNPIPHTVLQVGWNAALRYEVGSGERGEGIRGVVL